MDAVGLADQTPSFRQQALLLEGKATVEILERLCRAWSQVKDTSVEPSTACKRCLLLADVEDLHSIQPSRGVSLGHACDVAAQRGNLSVLKWLHANLPITGESLDPKTYFNDRGEFVWKAKVTAAEKALFDTEDDLKEENEEALEEREADKEAFEKDITSLCAKLYASKSLKEEDATKLVITLRDLLYERKSKKDIDELLSLATKLAKTWGVDLQSIFVGWELREELPASVVERIETLQLDQLFEWSSHRKLVTGAPVSDFKLHPGCDGRGLNMAQAAAFCDRVEIVDDMSRSMPATVGDSLKPTLDSIAKANESMQVLSWIQKREAGARLSSLVASHYRRKKAVAYKEFVLARWVGKGHLIRQKYRRIIEARLDTKKHYQFYWGDLAMDLSASEPADASWDALKQNQFNIAKSEHMMEIEAYGDTFRQLDEAQQEMETYESDDEEKKEEDPSERLDDEIREQNQEEGKDTALQELKVQEDAQEAEEPGSFDRTLPPLDNIEAVLTWIRKSEGKYVDFFLRRIQQLASGQRSRILQKNLVGSCTTIYETYLEQYSAQRILRTPVYESKKHCILIWYVARHKEVSHLMALIDAAQKRSSKSFLSAAKLYDEEWAKDTIVIDPEEILLDPIGDVPLKLHQVPRSELANLAQPNWVPPLRLTPEELKVVNKDGTVLLLGRSGTGKTLCIANRICLERDSHSGVPSFQQLFVARSRKICHHVRR